MRHGGQRRINVNAAAGDETSSLVVSRHGSCWVSKRNRKAKFRLDLGRVARASSKHKGHSIKSETILYSLSRARSQIIYTSIICERTKMWLFFFEKTTWARFSINYHFRFTTRCDSIWLFRAIKVIREQRYVRIYRSATRRVQIVNVKMDRKSENVGYCRRYIRCVFSLIRRGG